MNVLRDKKRAEIDEYTLRTICGGIYFDLTRFNKREIWKDHFDNLSGYLHIDKNSLYGVLVIKGGFILDTRVLSLKFIYDDLHEKRIVSVLHRAH